VLASEDSGVLQMAARDVLPEAEKTLGLGGKGMRLHRDIESSRSLIPDDALVSYLARS
jgi:hypothetical protein